MVNIMVRDSDSQVMAVYKYVPEAVANCTVYTENYNGPPYWGNLETPVYRHGIGDYREEIPV